ncbi:MAG: RDD family protein [Xanthobacteraceae bacterium]
MTSATYIAPSDAATPRYARLSRRIRTFTLDWIVVTAIIFIPMFAVTAINNSRLSRSVGVLVVITLMFYEPVLVWLTGRTVGHYLVNLRVVDDRTQGNVSFPKAVARVLLKTILGLYSFLAIMATRRNQALHDLITHTTVQIRDASKALPHHYISECNELAAPGIPSRARRLVVVFVYLALVLVTFFGSLFVLILTGVLSPNCVDNDVCSPIENGITITVGVITLGAIAAAIGFGWRGKLFGARAMIVP